MKPLGCLGEFCDDLHRERAAHQAVVDNLRAVLDIVRRVGGYHNAKDQIVLRDAEAVVR